MKLFFEFFTMVMGVSWKPEVNFFFERRYNFINLYVIYWFIVAYNLVMFSITGVRVQEESEVRLGVIILSTSPVKWSINNSQTSWGLI